MADPDPELPELFEEAVDGIDVRQQAINKNANALAAECRLAAAGSTDLALFSQPLPLAPLLPDEPEAEVTAPEDTALTDAEIKDQLAAAPAYVGSLCAYYGSITVDGVGEDDPEAAGQVPEDVQTARLLVSLRTAPYVAAGEAYLAWSAAGYPGNSDARSRRVNALLSDIAGQDCADAEGNESY